MGNLIQAVTKYLPYLDEVYKVASRSSVLETPSNFVRETADAKTVMIAKTSMQGLGNYDKANGFPVGDVTLTWESHTLSYDRGRSFSIDAMDNLETLGMSFGTLAGEFLRTRVIPEIDAVRFAKYCSGAGTTVAANLTASNTVTAIDTAETALKEAEIDLSNAIIFMTPTVYANIKDDTTHFTRTLVPSENPNRNFGSYDGMSIVEVPQTRFYSAVTLHDGRTDGQKNGGYEQKSTQTTDTFTGDGDTKGFTLTAAASVLDEVKVDGTATTDYDLNGNALKFRTAPASGKAITVKYGMGRDINFMIIKPEAVMQITKHAKMRVFDPDTNQTADAYKVDYRIYHDGWVLENKKKGIYAHVKATV